MNRLFTLRSIPYCLGQAITYPYWSILIIPAALFIMGCHKFEYNPYQDDKKELPSQLNQLNFLKLINSPVNDDTLCILFTGDCQRYYHSLSRLVEKSNGMDEVDMVIIAGDITDFGMAQEFIWIHELLEKLHRPYFCAIGNHDLLGSGASIYREVFGPENFSFKYLDHKLIFHNTNSREYNFNGSVPDLNWLANEFADPNTQYMLGVSHVPCYHEDFDPLLVKPYKDLLYSDQRFILSLSGHDHNGGNEIYYEEQVTFITSYSTGSNHCILIKLINGNIYSETVNY